MSIFAFLTHFQCPQSHTLILTMLFSISCVVQNIFFYTSHTLKHLTIEECHIIFGKLCWWNALFLGDTHCSSTQPRLDFGYYLKISTEYSRREDDITEIDITESDVAEFDITENDITESDITETNITWIGKLL